MPHAEVESATSETAACNTVLPAVVFIVILVWDLLKRPVTNGELVVVVMSWTDCPICAAVGLGKDYVAEWAAPDEPSVTTPEVGSDPVVDPATIGLTRGVEPVR